MKQLALRNGDFVLGTQGYQTITGPERIKQDLSIALREKYGSDRFHPKWGSLLDRYLGEVISDENRLLVQAEIHRVLQNYVIVQNAGVLKDLSYNVRGRYSTADIVREILAVEARLDLDGVLLTVVLKTIAREEISLTERLVT